MDMKELKQKWEKEQEDMDRYWWRRAYWTCYRFWHNYILTAPRYTKYFFQRRIRGYADEDLWNLYGHLGDHIIKVLKAFKKMDRVGVPGIFAKGHTDKQLEESDKRWNKELQDMIDGFDYLTNDDDIETPNWEKIKDKGDKAIRQHFEERKIKYKEAQKKASKLIKYFGNLWD
nr:hypothetical protein [Nanoarchaeota archaeon]